MLTQTGAAGFLRFVPQFDSRNGLQYPSGVTHARAHTQFSGVFHPTMKTGTGFRKLNELSVNHFVGGGGGWGVVVESLA